MGKRRHINSESSKNSRAEQKQNYYAAKKAETARYKAEHSSTKNR